MKKRYVVYPVGVDDVEKEKYANGGLDPEVVLAKRIAERLSGATVTSDVKPHKHEILIGNTRRAETREALARLAYNQYGIFCFGDRIAVVGHCVAATMKAAEKFLSMDSLELTDGFSLLETVEEWIVDFPQFKLGKYLGMSDCSHDRVEWVWGRVSTSMLEDYLACLSQEGYKSVFQNRRDGNRAYRFVKGTHFLSLLYLRATHTLRVVS